MNYDLLKLNNQLCFPLYAASRLITRRYQPLLEKIGITYPQYLVLMVLWETDGITVNEISRKLILNTNTITPLLKRMEKLALIERKRSDKDERKVYVFLTEKGEMLKQEAVSIPADLITVLEEGPLTVERLTELRSTLNVIIDYLKEK